MKTGIDARNVAEIVYLTRSKAVANRKEINNLGGKKKMYEITGFATQTGKKVRVVRTTKAEAEKHAKLARLYGGKNVRVRKIK